jgi:hypothetical protein
MLIMKGMKIKSGERERLRVVKTEGFRKRLRRKERKKRVWEKGKKEKKGREKNK